MDSDHFMQIQEWTQIIEHLLQNARSDGVREQFLSQPAEDYSAMHSLQLLVISAAPSCQAMVSKADV